MEVKRPVEVPGSYAAAKTIVDKVIFAVSEIGRGDVEAIVKIMEWHEPGTDNKQLIADTHNTLTELYKQGLLKGTENNGNLLYSIPQF